MLEGRYFFAHSARFVLARAAVVAGKMLRIESLDAAVLAEVPMRKVRVAARLGRIARRFDLPDGACFETDDNDGADAMLREVRRENSRPGDRANTASRANSRVGKGWRADRRVTTPMALSFTASRPSPGNWRCTRPPASRG